VCVYFENRSGIPVDHLVRLAMYPRMEARKARLYRGVPPSD